MLTLRDKTFTDPWEGVLIFCIMKDKIRDMSTKHCGKKRFPFLHASATKEMAAVGFEPTPPKRLEP